MSDRRRREISRRIYEARSNLGLTQKQLAKLCGLYPSTISRFETGERLPTAPSYMKLSTALGQPIPYLRAYDIEDEECGDGSTG